jgi:nucleoside phosphorylase
MAAARAMLDEIHPSIPAVDNGIYVLGGISGHNIVVACLPAGVYGICSASLVATRMTFSFPKITFVLMVGIAGGVPSYKADLRLGDVVVSRPMGTLSGVVQYDYGKTIRDGKLHRAGSLSKPPSFLLSATAALEASHALERTKIPSLLSQMLQRYPSMDRFLYPATEPDILFESDYQHIQSSSHKACMDCSQRHSIRRRPRTSSDPVIHYGIVASGNQVMRDGLTRDRIAHEFGDSILSFEMEASGLMDNFPCLVIRGICDYADSHKNKQWQPYAAAAAAAYAKELLSTIPARHDPRAQESDTYSPRQAPDEYRSFQHATIRSIDDYQPDAGNPTSPVSNSAFLLTSCWKSRLAKYKTDYDPEYDNLSR